MAKHDRAQKKHLKEVRRKQRRKSLSTMHASGPLRKTAEFLDEVYGLINDGELPEALELLLAKDRQNPRRPEIVEALLSLYQRLEDHLSVAIAAERLVRLRPRDAEAWFILAQGYMFTTRIALALNAYRHALERWPHHDFADKARIAVGFLEKAVDETLHDFGLSQDEFDLLVLHDEVLFKMASGNFEDSAAKAKELLKIKPTLVSARNNLTLALFQSGEMAEAIRIARESTQQFPDNRFAEAALGRTLFLTGNLAEAGLIADRIAEHPADQQDAIAIQTEFLGLLGRDDDVLKLIKHADTIPEKDPRCCAVLKHYEAVTLWRQGEQRQARRSWKACLKFEPNFTSAADNLEDLEAGANSHAPWLESLQKWIPLRTMEGLFSFLDNRHDRTTPTISQALKKWPYLRSLIPALLDRGDPTGREFAFRLARADASPDMLDALRDFAFGQRGPDRMRYEALMYLQEKGGIGRGPHRMWCRGAWTEVQLLTAKIHSEPTLHPNPEMVDLMELGYNAMAEGDYKSAERHFRRCVEIDPNYPSSLHNLAGSLLGQGKISQGREMLLSIHAKFPDYFFGRTSLAQLAIQDGDLPRARELLKPLSAVEEMHVSEAMAHAVVQAELALAEGFIESAEQSLRLMEQIDESDPRVAMMRDQISHAKRRKNSFASRLFGFLGDRDDGDSVR